MSKEINKTQGKKLELDETFKEKREIRVNNFNPYSDDLTQMVQFAVQITF